MWVLSHWSYFRNLLIKIKVTQHLLISLYSYAYQTLILQISPCFGVLFSRYLLELGASSITTAWIFNVECFLLYLMGVIVSPLSKEFGWQSVGILGCVLTSVSIIISAFSPSAEFLFFSFSLLTGKTIKSFDNFHECFVQCY